MGLWSILGIVCSAGALGGVINALLTDNGFVVPVRVQADEVTIVRPGVIGNILISAIAAGVSWGLYGPFAVAVVVGSSAASTPPPPNLTLSSLVGAVLVGISGAKWLTNEVDKNLLKAAAAKAASGQASAAKAQQIALASPANALKIASTLA
jgi:hypothetical protein